MLRGASTIAPSATGNKKGALGPLLSYSSAYEPLWTSKGAPQQLLTLYGHIHELDLGGTAAAIALVVHIHFLADLFTF